MKVGPPVSETIRLDRRPRSDGSGGLTTRLPETWEEAHEVLCELEGVKAGSRAFTAARSAGQHIVQGGGQDPKGKGKGKGKDKGKGDGHGEKKTVCFEWRDKGTCRFGGTC